MASFQEHHIYEKKRCMLIQIWGKLKWSSRTFLGLSAPFRIPTGTTHLQTPFSYLQDLPSTTRIYQHPGWDYTFHFVSSWELRYYFALKRAMPQDIFYKINVIACCWSVMFCSCYRNFPHLNGVVNIVENFSVTGGYFLFFKFSFNDIYFLF